jgi:hypothetical protein
MPRLVERGEDTGLFLRSVSNDPTLRVDSVRDFPASLGDFLRYGSPGTIAWEKLEKSVLEAARQLREAAAMAPEDSARSLPIVDVALQHLATVMHEKGMAVPPLGFAPNEVPLDYDMPWVILISHLLEASLAGFQNDPGVPDPSPGIAPDEALYWRIAQERDVGTVTVDDATEGGRTYWHDIIARSTPRRGAWTVVERVKAIVLRALNPTNPVLPASWREARYESSSSNYWSLTEILPTPPTSGRKVVVSWSAMTHPSPAWIRLFVYAPVNWRQRVSPRLLRPRTDASKLTSSSESYRAPAAATGVAIDHDESTR